MLVQRLRLLATTLALTGCAAHRPAPVSPAMKCAAGDSVLARETLYFGRNRPGGGTVGDDEWKRFLAEVVTPRFPLGLTVQDATGQWRGATGVVEEERSEIVTIFHPANEAASHSVREIALEYKRRFQQEAVLHDRTATCVRFE